MFPLMDGDEIKSQLAKIHKTQAELSRFLGMPADKLNKSLSGKRRFQISEIEKINNFFALYGKDAVKHDEYDEDGDSHFRNNSPYGRVAVTTNATVALWSIPELDMSLGGSSGGAMQHYRDPASGFVNIDQVDIRLEWQVPADWVSSVPAPGEKRLFIIPVLGKSMSPDFNPGDRVLVNWADRRPSPAGAFVVWDGISLVIKLVNYIPHSSPPRVQLISRDRDIPTYERNLDEAYIQGRVVGKWDWQ